LKTEASTHTNTPSKKKRYRILRIFGKIALGFLIFFILVVLFVRSPWGQNIIKDKLVTYVSDKTNTKITIDKLFLTFDGDIEIDGLYLEDTKGDTLIYSKTLEANIALWPVITGKGVGLDALGWRGVRANIHRKDTISGYNFEFLMDAFPSSNTTSTPADTTASPMAFTLGRLNLKDFNVVYNDEVAGIDSHFVFGTLLANMETTNIETMEFRAENLKLSDANIKFYQKPVPQIEEEEPVPLPTLSAETLELQNIIADYQSEIDFIRVDADINEFYAEIPNATLSSNTFNIEALRLKKSTIKIYTQTETNAITDKPNEANNNIENDTKLFEWPNFRMTVNNIILIDNKIGYYAGQVETKKGVFNPNALILSNLNLKANSIAIKDETAGVDIQSASFIEKSGYHLKAFKLKTTITDKKLNVSKIVVALNESEIQGNLSMNYATLESLLEAPEDSKINLDFPEIQINTNDLSNLQPQLKENKYFSVLSRKNFSGNIKGSGYLSDIDLQNANIFWGDSTQVSANGTIKNVTNPDKLQYNIPEFSIHTTKNDLIQFIDEKQLNISLPENVKLSGNIQGGLTSFKTKSKLSTTQGIATIDGEFKSNDDIAFGGKITIENYQLNTLLNNPKLGELTATIETSGNGKNINALDADIEATINSFNFNNYAINNLKLEGQIKNGTGNLTSKYKDKNINADLVSTIVLDSVAPKVTLELDVVGADLQALGLFNRNIKTGFKLYADFSGNTSRFDLAAILDEGVVVYDNKTYLLGDINAMAYVRQDSTSFSVQNKLLDFNLQSNTNPETFSKALKRHVFSYFYRDTEVPDTLSKPVNLKLRGHIAQAPILNEVFLVNIKDLDTIDISVDFNEINRKLIANIYAPHINYSGYEVDSLAFYMNTDKDKFSFNFGFNEINAGSLLLPKSEIKGNQTNNELSLSFLASYDETEIMNIEAEVTGDRERLRFHVVPTNLVLNKEIWTIPQDNEIIITDKNLAFNNFKINKNTQSIEITDKLNSSDKNHIGFDFNNFKLQEVFSYLNPNQHLAKGNLSGKFIIEEPFNDTGFIADLDISKLSILDVDLGKLSLDGKSVDGKSYNLEARMKGGNIDLDMKGNYIADIEDTKLDLDIDINTFKMSALTGFSQGEIIGGHGNISGNFNVTGTTQNPKYEGYLNFDDADFKIAMFNSGFTLKNEKLSVNNAGLRMTDFTVLDENKNAFVISGEIGTETFLNPTFNLKIKADKFQMLNASSEDNNFLYGKAILDVEANVTGDLQIPKIDMTATVNSETNITYVMPTATAHIEERDGVVIFVNRENPEAILTRTEEKKSTLTGFDITTALNVEKGAVVTVVIDEETGDNFKVAGTGEFNFNMKPNGRMNLVGVYNISDGHYEMNLYNLVNKRFTIAPESKVKWFGNPFDAKLDIKAIYNVETSASSLMAPAFSGIDASAKGKYRQVLPFFVYLNIDGELMAPKISFNLDMPEDEQGAIGGQVYGRVQQINQQEDELNRQVFSLLVLNRFYPDSGSDGSSGGVASIARDNLNDALSDQLNIFSDKIFGKTGLEVDFGLDSYTDYQGNTPQDRTQLNIAAQKKLFDDRLIARVGSDVDLQGSSTTNEATPLIGNVSLEYMLTENGRYRLKGFRRNEFENVIDGQTISTGIALIFTQEFNKFNELWDAMFKSQTGKEKAQNEELKRVEEAQEKTQDTVNESMEKKKSN
tara:strand:+ start:6509 stop:11611 length:5103 start_codon:yes stop_codon:yes gene_type:complete